MLGMPRPRLPHLRHERTRHGRRVWYVRMGDGPRIRLHAPFGSPEFMAEYQAATGAKGKPQPQRRFGPETLQWLWDRYRDSLAWAELSEATRRQRINVMKRVLAESPHVEFGKIRAKHIRDGIDRRRATPAAARHFLETLRGLFKWAVPAELATLNPTDGVETPRKATEGHHVWTEEECALFERTWPLGTRERLAYDVLLWTGLRRGDAVILGRQHVRDGVATLRTEKGKEPVEIPILAPLAASIAAGPTGSLAFIVGARGEPMTKEAFGNWFRKVCNATGLPHCSAHGLRKAGATRAANAGASEHELMALFGWVSPRMAAHYTRKANRSRLAKAGSEKVARSIR